MAWYKNPNVVKHSTREMFDITHKPGEAAPRAGIYQCVGCGREIGIADGHTLPPENHHEHKKAQGKIRWKLIVRADHTEKDVV